jgi:hypothetical protein
VERGVEAGDLRYAASAPSPVDARERRRKMQDANGTSARRSVTSAGVTRSGDVLEPAMHHAVADRRRRRKVRPLERDSAR